MIIAIGWAAVPATIDWGITQTVEELWVFRNSAPLEAFQWRSTVV